MHRLRRNSYLCALGLIVLLVSACASATPTPTVAPAVPAPTIAPILGPTNAALSAEVSWMVLADPEQIQAFQAVAAAFETKNPGLKVNLVSAADNEEDYHAALGTAMAGGSPPDVVNLDYDATAQYAAAGGLTSISNAVGQSTVIHAADFYPPAWQGFQWQGQQICLPISVSGLMVYYNKKLFDAAKLAYPKAGWTWDEFLADAKALTKGADQFGVTVEVEFNTLLPFIWQNGGDLLAAAPARVKVANCLAAAIEHIAQLERWP